MRAFLIVCILSLVKLNLAYIITVDSHAEECFFDSAGAGAKLGEFLVVFTMKTNENVTCCRSDV
jgi:hypothetical protein